MQVTGGSYSASRRTVLQHKPVQRLRFQGEALSLAEPLPRVKVKKNTGFWQQVRQWIRQCWDRLKAFWYWFFPKKITVPESKSKVDTETPDIVPDILEPVKLPDLPKTVLLTFPKEGSLRIGRKVDDTNNICIEDQSVSRVHCQIQFKEGHYLISDLQSANGTFVNDEQVFQKRSLKPGDKIGFYEGFNPMMVQEIEPVLKLAIDIDTRVLYRELGEEMSWQEMSEAVPLKELAGAGSETVVQMRGYHRTHKIPMGFRLRDGFKDPGHLVEMDLNGQPRWALTREVIVVDRTKDDKLRETIEAARKEILLKRSHVERLNALSQFVDSKLTPVDMDGFQWSDEMIEKRTSRLPKRDMLLGEFIDNNIGGVCRHRAILFKLLADELSIPCALVRGRYGELGWHVWNEVRMDDGSLRVMDAMHRLQPTSLDDPYLGLYWKPDKTPYYPDAAKAWRKIVGD